MLEIILFFYFSQRSSRSKTSGNSVKTKASPRSYVNYSQLSGKILMGCYCCLFKTYWNANN